MIAVGASQAKAKKQIAFNLEIVEMWNDSALSTSK